MTTRAPRDRDRVAPRARFAVAVVASSVAAVAGLDQASANPPAPESFPDPVVTAPKVAERPSAVRKHDGGCFVTYPSGGTAKVDCPSALATEPVGQEIDRDESTGTCRHVPTTTWSGGSTGVVACPAVLLVVAKPGTMPDPAGTPIGAVGSDTAPVPTGFDPPMGGLSPPTPAAVATKTKDQSKRLDDDAPVKPSGCASACSIGDHGGETAGGAACATSALMLLGVTLRSAGRRARRSPS